MCIYILYLHAMQIMHGVSPICGQMSTLCCLVCAEFTVSNLQVQQTLKTNEKTIAVCGIRKSVNTQPRIASRLNICIAVVVLFPVMVSLESAKVVMIV